MAVMTAKPAQAKEETKVADTKPAATTKPADTGEAAEDAGQQPASARKTAGECVVDDGTLHMGRAVNGKVCSAHAMHYKADGTRR